MSFYMHCLLADDSDTVLYSGTCPSLELVAQKLDLDRSFLSACKIIVSKIIIYSETTFRD